MKKIMFSAGEVSADVHGSNLAKKLLEIEPDLYLFGVGGEQMAKIGVDVRYNISPMSTVGAIEYLRYYPRLRKMGKEITAMMEEEKPDVVVLIDTQGFNLALAKRAKMKSIPTVYYFAPQAWHIKFYPFGEKVVKDVMETVSQVISVFPREYEVYKKYGDNVIFVGNPVVEVVVPTKDKDKVYSDLGLDPRGKVIGLFPGSRRQEVGKLLPIFVSAAKNLYSLDSQNQFVMSIASDFLEEYILDWVKDYSFIKTTRESSYNLMSISDVAIACSGTLTLEATIIGVPTVVVYKTSFITWNLANRLLNLSYISHPNMIAEEEIVPEFLQKDASAEKVTKGVLDLLEPSKNQKTKSDMARIREKLGGGKALEKAARTVLQVAGYYDQM